jgi:hypothetical protein
VLHFISKANAAPKLNASQNVLKFQVFAAISKEPVVCAPPLSPEFLSHFVT